MEQDKIGRFIAEERKAHGLTQKALAEQLGVTDKAVSKWERGLSCPDIALLSALSEALGATVSELLNGERAVASAPETVAIVETTLRYADAATKSRSKNVRIVLGVLLTACCVLGMLVCVICDLAITGEITWSRYPIVSVVFAWCICIPLVLRGRGGMLPSLIACSLLLVPFLYALERIIGVHGLIMPIGLPVSMLSILYLWVVYALFTKTRLYPYAAGAAALALCEVLAWGVNFAVSRVVAQPVFGAWDILEVATTLLFAGVILALGYLRHRGLLRTRQQLL